MSGKIKPQGLAIVVLVIILLYCGLRTLTTVGDRGWKVTIWAERVELDLESVVSDLEVFFTRLADTVYAHDYADDNSRNPLKRISQKVQTKKQSSERPRPTTPPPPRKPVPQLTGLILDRDDPVAIIKYGQESITLKRGGFFQGNQVIEIDESGVHLLVEGDIVTIR
jgi:hypothetical protein